MRKQFTVLLILMTGLTVGSLFAGKPVADYAVFSAETTGAVVGLWESKEYKVSDKTTGINFNKRNGTFRLYFSDSFIHQFDEYLPREEGHEDGAGHECFGVGGSTGFLGGTAQIQEMGFGKNGDMVMSLWIHAPNKNPDDDEEIFYVLELYNADEPPWDPSFPPVGTDVSVNTATSWEMRTTSNSYLQHEPCLGSGDFSFPGGENVDIEIKRLQ